MDHIAQDNLLDAMRIFDHLAEQAQKLQTFVERGRRIPELRARGLRSPLRELLPA